MLFYHTMKQSVAKIALMMIYQSIKLLRYILKEWTINFYVEFNVMVYHKITNVIFTALQHYSGGCWKDIGLKRYYDGLS